jgi:hypothetical protein
MDEDNPLPHGDVAFGPIVGVASNWLQFKVCRSSVAEYIVQEVKENNLFLYW